MNSVNETSYSHEVAFGELNNQENSVVSTKITKNTEREPLKQLPLLVTPETQTNISSSVKVKDGGKRSHRKNFSKKKTTTPLKNSLTSLKQKRLFDDGSGTSSEHPSTSLNQQTVEEQQIKRKRTCEIESGISLPRKITRLCDHDRTTATQPMAMQCSKLKENTNIESTPACSDVIKSKIVDNCMDVDKDNSAVNKGNEIPVLSEEHLQCQTKESLSIPISEATPSITQLSSPSFKTHQLKFQPHKEKQSNSTTMLSLGRENSPTLLCHRQKKRSQRKKQVSPHIIQISLPDFLKLSHHEGSTPQASKDISQSSTNCTSDDGSESISTHAKQCHVQSSPISIKKKRRQRCGKCTSCSTPECGECPECL